MDTRMIDSVAEAEKVIVGIGEDWEGRGEAAVTGYENLKKLLDGKDYYIISLCDDGVIEGIGFDADRLVTPKDETDDKWDAYNEWLGRTLNRKVCLLELGVGLKYPGVIRWPFEKITFVNNKAIMYRVHNMLYQTTPEMGEKCIGIKADALEYMA